MVGGYGREVVAVGDGSIRGIFISYRRDDAGAWAGRLFDRLAAHFVDATVFKDVEGIAPGEDFRTTIETTLDRCEVVLVIIGPAWLESTDDEGRIRLDDEYDFVRLEIQRAIDDPGNRVIPVLVGGARMPHPGDLPEALRDLGHRQAFELSVNRFGRDVDLLIEALERVPGRAAVTGAAAAAAGVAADVGGVDADTTDEEPAEPVVDSADESVPPEPAVTAEPESAPTEPDVVVDEPEAGPMEPEPAPVGPAGTPAPAAEPDAPTEQGAGTGRRGLMIAIAALAGIVVVIAAIVWLGGGDDDGEDTDGDGVVSSTDETAVSTTEPVEDSEPATTPPTTRPPVTTTIVEGDLGLGWPISNPSCDGGFLMIYGSVWGVLDPESLLVEYLDVGTAYAQDFALLPEEYGPWYALTRDSCSSLAPDIGGEDLYIAYFGPFEDSLAACDEAFLLDEYYREFGMDQEWALYAHPYVRQMSPDVMPGDDVDCLAIDE